MPVTKNCPSYNCEVNVRKVVCPSCDHVLRKHKPEEAKHRTLRRACPVRKIAVETADQVDRHRMLAREHTAKKRALETAEQADERRRLDRERAARKKAVETADQANVRGNMCIINYTLSVFSILDQLCKQRRGFAL